MFDGFYGAHRIGVAESRRWIRAKIACAFLLGAGCTALVAHALTEPSAESASPVAEKAKGTAANCEPKAWPYRDHDCTLDKNTPSKDTRSVRVISTDGTAPPSVATPAPKSQALELKLPERPVPAPGITSVQDALATTTGSASPGAAAGVAPLPAEQPKAAVEPAPNPVQAEVVKDKPASGRKAKRTRVVHTQIERDTGPEDPSSLPPGMAFREREYRLPDGRVVTERRILREGNPMASRRRDPEYITGSDEPGSPPELISRPLNWQRELRWTD